MRWRKAAGRGRGCICAIVSSTRNFCIPDDIDRFAQLDVIASVQPIHATQDMRIADRYWGPRSRYAYAFRSLWDSGAKLAFGSDAPVETPDVIQGIHAAVTRMRADGSPGGDGWYPAERLTVPEAVWAYTMGAAYAGGSEESQGSITPGKLADLVVLSQDIFTVHPMAILETDSRGDAIRRFVRVGGVRRVRSCRHLPSSRASAMCWTAFHSIWRCRAMRFIPGLELSRRFYWEAVWPVLDRSFPGLAHTAALIGPGSETLGFDDEMSMDHGWGPRLQLFLRPQDCAALGARIDEALRLRTAPSLSGLSRPTSPTRTLADSGTRLMQATERGPVNHLVETLTTGAFFRSYLNIDLDKDDRGGGLADLSAAEAAHDRRRRKSSTTVSTSPRCRRVLPGIRPICGAICWPRAGPASGRRST